jgi:hypothetical protein
MSKHYAFDKSKLKPIVKKFFTLPDGDAEKEALFDKPIRLFMSENIPMVYLSDGYHFIEAQFTKGAISRFRKDFNHLKFSQLRDKILYLNKWRMEIRSCNSETCFNSHQNLTLVIIVDHFKCINHERPREIDFKRARGLFEENEIKNFVKAMRKDFVTEMLEVAAEQAPDG